MLKIGPDCDMVIVKSRAAKGGGLIGTRQRIDSPSIRMGAVGPNAFCDQNTLLQAFKIMGMQPDSPALIGQFDFIPFLDVHFCRIKGVDHDGGATLALDRTFRLGEG